MDTIKNYTIKSELGRGGMATVFLAHDQKFDTNVAIKVLNKEFVHNENIRKRFLAEAKNMFKMSHSNIIKVTDLVEENDTVAFAMEYIEGETLKEYLESKGKLGDEEIKSLFTQMLDAVGYVHEQKLVHRDIKPSNFMITPSGKVKLMDFGIAKQTDSSSSDYTLTGTTQQMGTPMYMSPEQVHETKNVTAQSDIYSLGVVLWQMVTGKRPYDTKTLSSFQLQSKIVNEPLDKTNSHWDELILKATAKDMAARLINANAFKHALNGNNEKTESDATVIDSNVKQQPSPQPKANHANGSVREGAFSLDSKKTTVNQNSHLKEIFFGILVILGLIAALVYYSSNRNDSFEEVSKLETDSIATADSIAAATADSIAAAIANEAIENSNKKAEMQKRVVQVLNECEQIDDAVWTSKVSIDGVKYKWYDKIELGIGTHRVVEIVTQRENGDKYSDETLIQIDKNTTNNERIVVGLNCACPYYYYKGFSDLNYGGELIRNQNSRQKEKLDFSILNLSYLKKDTVYFIIKEEKPEVSYIDNIYVTINDSVKLMPFSTNVKTQKQISHLDKNYFILDQGAFFEIYFVLPKNISILKANIYSYGYYISK